MPLQVTTPEGSVELTPRKAQYQKTITGSNGYAEAILSLGQEEKTERKEKKNAQGESYFVTRIKERRFYFYTPVGDDTRLFQLLDLHSHIPLLLDFQEYVLSELRRCGALTPLAVLSSTETFDAWQLKLNEDEQNLHEILETGLHERKITIPGADPHVADAFEKVGTISQYLAKFGVTVAERIKERYQPLFDPSRDAFSREINQINDYIFQNTGYRLYDAQLAAAEAASRKNRPVSSGYCCRRLRSGKNQNRHGGSCSQSDAGATEKAF